MSAAPVTEKAMEHAKALLSSLFMSVRTAQIHDVRNQAFVKSIHTVHEAAKMLLASTDGFSLQFVEQSVFLNGTRVRFEPTLMRTIRALESALMSKGIGGLSMSSAPSFDAVRTLILELAKEGEAEMETLEALDIAVLGPQAFSEAGTPHASVDPKLLAVQSYAKLIIALREHFGRIRQERREGKGSRLRLRIVRVVQDLVELAGDRPDYLLRLSSQLGGAEPEVLHGVNACLIATAMAAQIHLSRSDMVDLAMGTLFHHIGAEPEQVLDDDVRDASLARVLADAGVSRSSLSRAIVVAHHRKRADGSSQSRRRSPHLFARLAGVAITYSQLISGYGTRTRHRAHPLDALQVMMEDRSGRFDPEAVDILINALRAFPVGCPVMLDSGEHATVASIVGSSRWDRPVVSVHGADARRVDLMVRDQDRFRHRIVATTRFLGLPDQPAAEVARPPSGIGQAPLAEPPKEELDALFREFLSDGDDDKPSVDTSYSSRKDG